MSDSRDDQSSPEFPTNIFAVYAGSLVRGTFRPETIEHWRHLGLLDTRTDLAQAVMEQIEQPFTPSQE